VLLNFRGLYHPSRIGLRRARQPAVVSKFAGLPGHHACFNYSYQATTATLSELDRLPPGRTAELLIAP